MRTFVLVRIGVGAVTMVLGVTTGALLVPHGVLAACMCLPSHVSYREGNRSAAVHGVVVLYSLFAKVDDPERPVHVIDVQGEHDVIKIEQLHL